jgi:DNA-binding MarR family transcriptional regulator
VADGGVTDDVALQAQVLRVGVGRVARRMRQLYASDRDGAPTFLEVAVLVHLSREGPSSPSELAGREHVTSQAIAIVAGELEARGLVVRAADPADRRRRVLTITPAGEAVLRAREGAVMTALVQALERFPAEERARLDRAARLLDRLADLL